MKGIIIYSSKTGNTKKMAEKIYDKIKEKFDIDIFNLREIKNVDEYDYVLLGSFIDRGTFETNAMRFLKKINNKNIGLFATLGAMPKSEHGIKVTQNLEELLKNKNSLGTYILPGVVDPKMIKKLQGITGAVVPKKVKEKMIETSLASRNATDEELENVANYFLEKIENLI